MAASAGEMERLIREVIDPLPGVKDISTNIILSRVKDIKGLRLSTTAQKADKTFNVLFVDFPAGVCYNPRCCATSLAKPQDVAFFARFA